MTAPITEVDKAGVGVLNTLGLDDSLEDSDLAASENTEFDIGPFVTEPRQLDIDEGLFVLIMGSVGKIVFDCDITAVPNIVDDEGFITVSDVDDLGTVESDTVEDFVTASGCVFETTGVIGIGTTIDCVDGAVGTDLLAAANIDDPFEFVDSLISFSGCTSFCITVSSVFRELFDITEELLLDTF